MTYSEPTETPGNAVYGNLYAQKNKKRLLVSGRKDAVPPDFVCSAKEETHSTSDNGLTRRKLTGHLPLHLRRLTGDRPSYLQGLAPTVLSLSRSVKIPPGHSRRNMKSDPFSRVTGLRLRSTPTRRGLASLRVDCISWS